MKVMFCRICGFRVRVWESYGTSLSSGYGYGSATELTEVPGICGTCVQNSQKFRAGTKNAVPVPRVLWHGAYRTHTSSRYGYERHTELEEVPGTGTGVLQNSQKFRVLWYGRTKLTEVPGGYKNAVPVPRVLWPPAYRSSGYGHECPTEPT